MSENKRFEEWEQVDCNSCARYWDSSCDGVKCNTNSDKALQGSTRLCNSFLATRSVVIPAKLNALEKRVDGLRLTVIILSMAVVFHLLTHIFGG